MRFGKLPSPARLIAGLLGFALLMLACKTVKDEQSRTADANLSEEEKQKLEEARAEIDIGRNMAGRLLQFYGVYEDKKLNQYINEVGNYVASFGDDPERRYMFEIIDTDIVNAFACPGGYILVSLGAIRHADNEAQLAQVLGHESVHVLKRHMFDKLKSMSKEEMDKVTKEAEEANRNLPEAVLVRKRPDPTDNSETGALLARYLSGSAAGLSVLQAAKAGMSLILEKGLGADLEYEADKDGVRYAIRAGYDPNAMLDFLCRLENRGAKPGRCKMPAKLEKKPASTILEKTHPPVADRVANIRDLLKEMKASDIVGAKGQKRFRRFTKDIRPPKEKTQEKS